MAFSLLLSSCGQADDRTQLTPAKETSSVEAPEDVTAQNFNPEAPDFEFLDICGALSPEDLKELKLTSDAWEATPGISIPSIHCSFDSLIPEEKGIFYLVGMDTVSEKVLMNQVERLKADFSAPVRDGVFFISNGGGYEEGVCAASKYTSRGRITFLYADTIRSIKSEEPCLQAYKKLSKILDMENL